MGPTSTWSYTRRALAIIEHYVPQAESPPDPFNTDGSAFRIKWRPKADVEQSDLSDLPLKDYALYLLSTVKFHLGEFFLLVDEEQFVYHLHAFYGNALATAQQHRLWFAEYLLILAFGKAFLVQGGPSTAPPGYEFGTRAMSLMPDLAQLHNEQMLSMEVLALAAIYCQSIGKAFETILLTSGNLSL